MNFGTDLITGSTNTGIGLGLAFFFAAFFAAFLELFEVGAPFDSREAELAVEGFAAYKFVYGY